MSYASAKSVSLDEKLLGCSLDVIRLQFSFNFEFLKRKSIFILRLIAEKCFETLCGIFLREQTIWRRNLRSFLKKNLLLWETFLKTVLLRLKFYSCSHVRNFSFSVFHFAPIASLNTFGAFIISLSYLWTSLRFLISKRFFHLLDHDAILLWTRNGKIWKSFNWSSPLSWRLLGLKHLLSGVAHPTVKYLKSLFDFWAKRKQIVDFER